MEENVHILYIVFAQLWIIMLSHVLFTIELENNLTLLLSGYFAFSLKRKMEPFKGKPSNEKKIKPIKEQKDLLVALLVQNREHVARKRLLK